MYYRLMNPNNSGFPPHYTNGNNFLRFIPLLFNFTKIQGVKRFSWMGAAFFALSACNWTTGVFERNQDFKDHEWAASVTPDLSFEITDTVALYNLYIVIRHTDAYHFNNLYVRATVKEPGASSGRSGDYDLQLATNTRGWIGTAMDDIYDARILVQAATKFKKAGTYHIRLEQLMREDPLKNVLSAGFRVERTL
jgi:gliding motility-associated lipoprotein GldH